MLMIVVDRDWLSSLAYAVALPDLDLLDARAAWVINHLANGGLTVSDTYLMFDTSPVISLARRATRLDRHHSWSSRDALMRLRAFYCHPHIALAARHPRLTRAIASADVTVISDQAAIDTKTTHVEAILEQYCGKKPHCHRRGRP